MKILIYISSLTSGGAEKVATLMANYWSHEHDVTILTNAPINTDFFKLHKKVKRCTTNYQGAEKENILVKTYSHAKALYQLRKMIKKESPDVIISHMDVANIRILYASAGLGIPIIIQEHNNPKMARKIPQPWRFLQPFAYRILASHIVLLTKDLLSCYPKSLHKKITIIPNPLNIPKVIPESKEITLKKPTFITMGSLRKIKGYDLLLQAFSLVIKKYPNWNLTILGEGSERKNLINLAKKLNIEKNIYMPGRVTEPYGILKNADIYVLSSRSEAFPVALCEAMGVGLPCISFNCPTGPSDIIKNGINGLLVDPLNEKKLAETMIYLVKNSDLRKKLSCEAIKINDTLALDRIMNQWESVINIILEKP